MRHKKVLEFLNKSEIVVVPSRWEEPFGRTALESSSRACATIISNKGGLPETTDHCIILKKIDSTELYKELKNLINNEKLSLEHLIKLMCENPCKIFGIKNKGFIKEGFDADLTIVDMKKEQIIKDEMIASKCGWTPFNNYKVKGFPIGTIVNGNLVMSEGKIIIDAQGQPLNF